MTPPKRYRLRPSSADRWINCPGSLRLCADLPELPSSSYAEEGSRAHIVFEMAQRTGALTREMCESDEQHNALLIAMDAMAVERRRFVTLELEVYEAKVVPLRAWPETAGSADVVMVGRLADGRRAVTISDLKYGKNVLVSPGSPQIALYGLGAADLVGGHVDTMRTVVIQPRLKRTTIPPVRSIDHSRDGMAQFLRKAANAAHATTMPDAPLVPGSKWCMWCAAKDVCPAKGANARGTIDPDFAAMVAGEI